MVGESGGLFTLSESRRTETSHHLLLRPRCAAARRVCGLDSPANVTAKHVKKHVEALRKQVSAKTVHESQLGIRRFFKYLVTEREIRRDPSRQVKLTRYRVVPQPTYVVDDLKKLLTACDQSVGGVRGKAIITVLFDTGVRVG